MTMTRRHHLSGLLALGVTAAIRDVPVPPPGIGRRIRHLSYSDQGGRPDGVQVMVNRRHVYVGHMFSDGVTILDAADPRRLKPVGFVTAGTNTRTHHLQVSGDLLLLANTARRPGDVVGPALDAIEGLVATGAVDEAQIDRALTRIGRLALALPT